MRYALLFAFALLLSAGQILFKKAALSGVGSGLAASFINTWMIAALTLYGGATILWVWLLRTIPLSIAYPFAALGFILVPLSAALLFGEPIRPSYMLGSILIVAGIAIIGIG